MTSSRSQLVTIATADAQPLPTGASIRFTRDGSTPNDTSELYVDPFIVDHTATIKAIVTGGGPDTSDVESFPIVIRVATPVITPSAGTFDVPTIITMTCATPNAEIRFTIDGPLPDEVSTLYTGPFLLEASHTIQARAFLSPKDPSANATATIVIESTSAVYFGYSPLLILTEAQVKAMSNSPELANSRTASDFFGTYVIGGGATVDDYFYFWCPGTFSFPRASDGFTVLTSSLGNLAMATPSRGFTDGPNNGFYHKDLTVDGILGRLYRTYLPVGDGSHSTPVTIQ